MKKVLCITVSVILMVIGFWQFNVGQTPQAVVNGFGWGAIGAIMFGWNIGRK